MAAPTTTATYDLPVLNAMIEVESFFQEMLCEAYGADEDDLPGDIPDLDVVKFAELSDEAVRNILYRALSPHPFKKSGVTIEGVIGATLEKISVARSTSTVKWPTQHHDDGSEGKDDDDEFEPTLEHTRSVHMPEGPSIASHESTGHHVVTAHYDLKTMNRIQQINNKFNDQLVQLYGVEDEDFLPSALTDITLGDLVVNSRMTTEQICKTLDEVITSNPWTGMDKNLLNGMLAKLSTDLEPFVQKISEEVASKK